MTAFAVNIPIVYTFMHAHGLCNHRLSLKKQLRTFSNASSFIYKYLSKLSLSSVLTFDAKASKIMERWVGKVAVVTGASSGIGSAVAEKLTKAGIITVGLARRCDKLVDLEKQLLGAKGTFYPKKCDVTNEEELVAMFALIKREIGPVSILVNNAGVLRVRCVHEQTTREWKETIDTNVLALCLATREATAMMKEGGIAGHVIHVNSICGLGVPDLGVPLGIYPATKHAVTALTEILRQEMTQQSTGIKVTSIHPGLVMTEMVEGFVADALTLKPEDIADCIYYVLSTPPTVQIQNLTIRHVGEKVW